MDKTSRGVERDAEAEIRVRTRRGFLIAGAAAVAGGGFWRWLNDRPQIDGLNSPFRKALEFDARIARGFFHERAIAPEFERSEAVRSFRRNGDIGLSDIRSENWRLQLVGVLDPASYVQYSNDVTSWTYGMNHTRIISPEQETNISPKKPRMHEDDAKGAAVRMKPMEMPESASSGVAGLLLTMADVNKLPHFEMVTEFMCIEGWSEIVNWGGARLHDFVAAFTPAGLPEYIGFETPDSQYYIGIEREVALHPQTLIAYELNGQPLTPDHGAPLRLVTPLKYGIKQLKQIGRITYTQTRPRDFWHEQGYDYYAGL
jgi:hypothetical protein